MLLIANIMVPYFNRSYSNSIMVPDSSWFQIPTVVATAGTTIIFSFQAVNIAIV